MPKTKKSRDHLRGYVPEFSPLPPYLMSPKAKGSKNEIKGKRSVDKKLQAKKPKRYVKGKDLAGNRSQASEQ